jgi:transcriptional regulator with XRE-family HTH domain
MTTTFAMRLRYHMFGWTVESLAVESGYSEKYITQLRNGHKTNPTIECVKCLATVLGVPPALLAYGAECVHTT